MKRNLFLGPFILLFISGCLTADHPAEPQQSPPAASETQKLAPDSVAQPAAPAGGKTTAPGKDEIRAMQARLKMAGFNPGPLDGIIGPKTMTALRRFYSGCAMMKDVMMTSEALLEPLEPALAAKKIRFIQARLRAAGFNPGPGDGIMGPKTRSALGKVQSGCPTVQTFLANLVQTSEGQLAASVAAKKPIQPLAATRLIRSSRKTPTRDEIQLVQVRLKNAGYDPGPIDGVLGPKTRTAIHRYRASRGLVDSGIEGMLE